MSKMTLDEAVNNAIEQEEKAPESTEEVTEETTETEETEEEDSEEEAGDEEFTAEQLEKAKQLYKQLSNPKTSVDTINQMVRNAGYTLSEIKEATVSDKKDIAVELVDILKEELGDDFELVAGDKLAAALAKVLDLKVSQALKPLETKLEQAEFESRKKEVDKALDWAYNSLEGFKTNESLILDKMKTYPYQGKGTYQKYLTEMHALATSGAAQKRTQRAESNIKNDVKASRAVRPSATKPTAALSLDEAIEMALAEIKN
jgi:hypothetical protein